LEEWKDGRFVLAVLIVLFSLLAAMPCISEAVHEVTAERSEQGSPYVWIYRKQGIDWAYSSYKELLWKISG
jgi:ABC-type sugar transport system substrate-binding protein